MMIKNVFYDERPTDVIVQKIGNSYRARVDMPTNITEEVNDEGHVSYKADVYTLETLYTDDLHERVLANRDKWIAKAAIELPAAPTIQDAIEAINVLTEIVLGDDLT